MSAKSVALYCTCSFAGTSKALALDEYLALGYSAVRIEREMKAKGMPCKRETVGKHLSQCLGGLRPTSTVRSPLPELPRPKPPKPNDAGGTARASGPVVKKIDLAALIQQKTIERLLNGEVEVTVKDGLAATAILDKREARTEDRRFLVGLARLLSGAGMVGPQGDDPNVVLNVTPPAANPLLAPPSLRADE